MLDEKARELGRLIGQSPEYQAVKRANEALNSDRDAVALLRQMDQLRDQAQRMIELVAPFRMPSVIQLFTWSMVLSKFSCAAIAR